jgi:hypothetical protein
MNQGKDSALRQQQIHGELDMTGKVRFGDFVVKYQ